MYTKTAYYVHSICTKLFWYFVDNFDGSFMKSIIIKLIELVNEHP